MQKTRRRKEAQTSLMNKITAEEMRLERSKRGMKQAEFAALIGTTQPVYSAYERNRREIPSNVVKKFRDIATVDFTKHPSQTAKHQIEQSETIMKTFSLNNTPKSFEKHNCKEVFEVIEMALKLSTKQRIWLKHCFETGAFGL